MSESSSKGEASSKQQENGDVVSSTDRPLKKARFAWQVKGKHHLKTEKEDEAAASAAQCEPEKMSSSSESESETNENGGSAEQNLEILGDYLLKTDFNTIDSVINETKASHLLQASELERLVSSNGTLTQNSLRSSCTSRLYDEESNEETDTGHENILIARWQARQMAKGFVDNTINRVLESWMETPMPPSEMDPGFMVRGVEQFMDSRLVPLDNSVENEGILMAISAHGLQNASSSNEDNSDESSTPIETIDSSTNSTSPSSEANSHILELERQTSGEEIPNGCSCSKKDSEITFDDWKTQREGQSSSDSECSGYNNEKKRRKKKNKQNKVRGTQSSESNNLETPIDEIICSEPIDEDEDLVVAFAQQESLRIADVPIFISTEEEDLAAHFNFMEAAVLFAIQSNGLAAYGANFG